MSCSFSRCTAPIGGYLQVLSLLAVMGKMNASPHYNWLFHYVARLNSNSASQTSALECPLLGNGSSQQRLCLKSWLRNTYSYILSADDGTCLTHEKRFTQVGLKCIKKKENTILFLLHHTNIHHPITHSFAFTIYKVIYKVIYKKYIKLTFNICITKVFEHNERVGPSDIKEVIGLKVNSGPWRPHIFQISNQDNIISEDLPWP